MCQEAEDERRRADRIETARVAEGQKALSVVIGLQSRIAELETECGASKQMEAALIQAAHRLAELGDGLEHPVRAAIEAALDAYSPAVEE